MARPEDIEGGPKITRAILILAVVLVAGYGLIVLLLDDQVSGLVGLAFLVFATIGWGVWVGLYQSRSEARAKR